METAHERLFKENEELKRKLREAQGLVHAPSPHAGAPQKVWRPSAVTIWAIFLAVAVFFVIAFFVGYIPVQRRNTVIAGEAHDQEIAPPRVGVLTVGRSSGQSELQLPGNIQAITEAPVLARAEGYVQRRLVDIGDRVEAGQTLVQLEAPEMEEQVLQAKANVQQAQATLDQALASYEQGQADLDLSRITAERWNTLATRGIVARQENDQYQAQFKSRTASVQALQKAINVQRSNVSAAQANLSRLEKMQTYLVVKAPFAGVITLRNVDVGALVNTGSTLLFRIAQTGTLRVYVNVPQSHANSIHPGQPAQLSVSNLPDHRFTGVVARTASALDPTTRTLLVEVHVPNASGLLLPGMYAQVDLSHSRTAPPLLIPSDALVLQASGSNVAVVQPDHTVHLQKIEIGRDYGDRLEVTSGLHEGDTIIPNPGDLSREGLKVDPFPLQDKNTSKSPHP